MIMAIRIKKVISLFIVNFVLFLIFTELFIHFHSTLKSVLFSFIVSAIFSLLTVSGVFKGSKKAK